MADRRGGNQSRLCLGACRCLVEDEGNRQVSQKLKALEQSQKQLTTIIIGGAHDDGSHGPKCLMGLRPATVRLREWRRESRGLAAADSREAEPQHEASYELAHYDQRTGSDNHGWLLLCILMLLYIVKRLDPLFGFGQVLCSAFDFADVARRHGRRAVRQRHGRIRRRRIRDRAGVAAQAIRRPGRAGIGDVPVGLVVELEASPPVAGLQGTGTDRNRVLCRPSGTSRLIMKAEQNQFISVRIRQQYIRDRVRLAPT